MVVGKAIVIGSGAFPRNSIGPLPSKIALRIRDHHHGYLAEVGVDSLGPKKLGPSIASSDCR